MFCRRVFTDGPKQKNILASHAKVSLSYDELYRALFRVPPRQVWAVPPSRSKPCIHSVMRKTANKYLNPTNLKMIPRPYLRGSPLELYKRKTFAHKVLLEGNALGRLAHDTTICSVQTSARPRPAQMPKRHSAAAPHSTAAGLDLASQQAGL